MTTINHGNVIPKIESEISTENNSRLLISCGIIVSLFAVILYFNTLFNDYAYDDTAVITGNSLTTKGISGIPEMLKTSYWYGFTGINDHLYRPLPIISLAIEWQLSPGNPYLNHFSNILLYALTGFLLFIFLAILLRDFNLVLPFTATLIFIAHPLHTEVVANIKGRDEIFCFLFFLISGIALLKSIDKKSRAWLIITSLSYFLSLSSKETAFTFILIFPLIIFYFRDIPIKNLIFYSALFLFILLIFYLVRTSVVSSLESYTEKDFLNNSLVLATDITTRIGTAFYVMGLYIKLLIFPDPLSIDYSYSQIPITGIINPVSFAAILFYLLILIYALVKLFWKDFISFSIFIFLIPVLLISNLFYLTGSTMAERFMYIPSLGFSLAFTWIVMRLFKLSTAKEKYDNLISMIRPNGKFAMLIFVILVLYSFKTISRNSDWKNNYTLFSADSKTNSNSAILHYDLGGTLFNLAKKPGTSEYDRNQFISSAQKEFQSAFSIYPEYFEPYYQLAESYYFENKDSLAIVYYKKAMTILPEESNLIKNISSALIRYSENGNSPQMIIGKDEIARIINLLIRSRNADLSSRLYRVFLSYNHADVKSLSDLGIKFYNAGKYNEAIEKFAKIISMQPKNVEALNNLGSSYAMIHEYEKAKKCFIEVIALQPDDPVNYENLALLLKQKGDSVNADVNFAKAKELRKKSQ